MLKYLLLSLLTCLLLACGGKSEPVPRPMAYHRIDFPTTTSYTHFDNETCPFSFEYPAYGEISRDLEDSCWVDIYFPPYDCKWHLTYRNVNSTGKSRSVHFEEHRKLVYKHVQKARQIKDGPFQVRAGYGTVYEVYGNVGAPTYIFMSDSTDSDILMATFYFQTALKNDSLAPVIEYMKGQLNQMLQTFEWE